MCLVVYFDSCNHINTYPCNGFPCVSVVMWVSSDQYYFAKTFFDVEYIGKDNTSVVQVDSCCCLASVTENDFDYHYFGAVDEEDCDMSGSEPKHGLCRGIGDVVRSTLRKISMETVMYKILNAKKIYSGMPTSEEAKDFNRPIFECPPSLMCGLPLITYTGRFLYQYSHLDTIKVCETHPVATITFYVRGKPTPAVIRLSYIASQCIQCLRKKKIICEV